MHLVQPPGERGRCHRLRGPAHRPIAGDEGAAGLGERDGPVAPLPELLREGVDDGVVYLLEPEGEIGNVEGVAVGQVLRRRRVDGDDAARGRRLLRDAAQVVLVVVVGNIAREAQLCPVVDALSATRPTELGGVGRSLDAPAVVDTATPDPVLVEDVVADVLSCRSSD